MTRRALTIYCHCAYYELTPEDTKSEVLDGIKACGVEFEAVSDLCRMCAEQDPKLKDWAGAESLKIFACYPRAVKSLFAAAGAPLPADGVEFVNMRDPDLKFQISDFKLEIDDSTPQDRNAKSEISNLKFEIRRDDWTPWFPVIDYERCQNCKQCLNFCLFGVYELSEDDKVEVRNPANCKTNCPACARTCPHTAIIFPKYGESPVNGDRVPESNTQDEQDKANLAELMNGDVYDTIRKRAKGAKRFSAEEDPARDPALRQGCPNLKKLQEALGIPTEVLASFSPKDIARIREKAGAKTSPSENSKTESEGYE